jgi:putative heme-binding domain-containing protein
MRRQLAVCIGARKDPGELTAVFRSLAGALSSTADRSALLSVLAGLGDGLKRARLALRNAASAPEAKSLVDDLLKQAAAVAADDSQAEDLRVEAIELVGHEPFATAREVLAPLLAPRQSVAIQRAAVRILAAFPDTGVTALMLDHWRGLSPALRTEIVDQLLARADRTTAVLDAVESGVIPASQISPARQTLLLKHKDAAIAARASKLLASQSLGQRKEVIAQYQSALTLSGDEARGRALFEKECITCHKNGDKGHDVGPNLSTIRHRTPGEVLTHILDPNREVGPNFVNYVVTIDDGRIATGLIDSETATSVVLKRAEGVTETILRANIEAMSNSGQSLMPEGLEKKLSPQDMADLLVFLLGKK